MSTSASRDEYRFIAQDEERVVKTIVERGQEWTRQAWPHEPRIDREALRRLCAHSIGCSIDDLRDSELAWIDARIGEWVGCHLTVNG